MKKKISMILLFCFILLNLNIVSANTLIKKNKGILSLVKSSISRIVTQNYTKRTVDITYLAMGDEVGHNHVYETKYDEVNHWKECIICNLKIEIMSHSYSESWTMGDSCSPDNKLNHVCNCGYSYQTNNTRAHKQWHGVTQHTAIRHLREGCSSCGYGIVENHYDAYGALGCKTGRSGTCIACGYVVSGFGHECSFHPNFGFSGSLEYKGEVSKCKNCDKVIISSVQGYVNYNDREITYGLNIFYPWGNSRGITWGPYYYFVPTDTGSILNSNCEQLGAFNRFTVTGRVIDGYESTTNMCAPHNVMCDDGLVCTVHLDPIVIAEIAPPNILNISERDISSYNDWATSKEITISGTENYCSTVSITVTDNDENVYIDNAKVVVSGGQFSYSFIPNIEADENGREINITVTDSLGNANTQKYTIYKIDNYTPSFVGDLEYLTPWSKSKDVTFYAKDSGVKDVKIGFEEESDLQLADEIDGTYQREYTFVGDVYGQTVTRVYAEDGLGNITTEYVKLGNLDNTAPTITNLNKTFNDKSTDLKLNVQVEANDINVTLGKSGSGITHYAITTTNNMPDENSNTWQESNLFEITENGTYYVWAKDLVGNISNPKELVVDEFTISYKVMYYLKNENDDYILEDEEELIGKLGEEVTPTVKEYIGYKSPEPQTVTITKDGIIIVEYYYELIKGKVIVTKADKKDNTKLLSGAIFKIEKLDDQEIVDTRFTVQEKETGENGKVEFIDLLVGKYKVTEIKAPEGYELAKEPIIVDITNENSEINITATDRLKLELPEAGGRGIYLFITLGSIVIISSLIIKYKSKNEI